MLAELWEFSARKKSDLDWEFNVEQEPANFPFLILVLGLLLALVGLG